MIVHDIPTANKFYQDIYNFKYMKGPDTLGLKTSDSWPAFCYMHGINDVPTIFNIQEQIDYITKNRKNFPHQVIEIGSGRGELSAALASLDYLVDTIECNPSARHFHRATYRRFFDRYPGNNYRLFQADLSGYLDHVPQRIDDLLLVESIEHIDPSEWKKFYDSILPIMKISHTRLTITNQKHYWPLGFKGDAPEHIALIDDDFYDALASDARSVLYRDRSHICLEF